jgi:hypothetical protein
MASPDQISLSEGKSMVAIKLSVSLRPPNAHTHHSHTLPQKKNMRN